MINYNTEQFPLMAGNDDGSEWAASVNKLYGPWEDEDELKDFLSEITGASNPTIPNGLVACFNDVEPPEVRMWVTAFGTTGYWSKDISRAGNIVIAGTISEYTLLQSTSSKMGDSTNVYYDETNNRLVLSEDGLRGYAVWKNYPDYGVLVNGRVIPFEKRIYMTMEGEVLICTDKDVAPGGGVGGLTPAQQAAVNSGITAEMVQGLQRLIALNPQYDSTTDELWLTDESVNPPVTSKYNLNDSGTVVTYGEPEITVSYDTISPNGDRCTPNIEVGQDVYTNGVKTGRNTYTGISELRAALKIGDSLRFAYAVSGADTFDSLDPSTGEIVASANATSIEISASISVTLKLNGANASPTVVTATQSTPTLYITEFFYDRVDLSEYTDGDVSVTPKVRAGGQVYTLAEYAQLSNIESFTLSEHSTNQGETFTAATGAITYDPTTLVGALEGEDNIGRVRIKLEQTGRTDLFADFAMIDFADEDYSYVSGMTLKQTLGGSTSNKLQIQSSQTARCLRTGLSVTAGDIVAIKIPTAGTWYWVWETESAVTGATTADYGYSSSADGGVIIYKVKQTGVLSIGWVHGSNTDYSHNEPTGYLKVDTSDWT